MKLLFLSLLGIVPGPHKQVLFYQCSHVLPPEMSQGDLFIFLKTYQPKTLAISGKALLAGRFPDLDQYGNPLKGVFGARAGSLIANGWLAAFESWCGDWKERASSHTFVKRNYQSTLMCDQCSAVQPHKKTPQDMLPMAYSNFSTTAPWATAIRCHDDYLKQTVPAQRSPWCALPGFDLNRIRWDTAHTILLGTGKDMAASFLWDLVTWPSQPFAILFASICNHYKMFRS